ncbi:uncharacterized protein LOC123869125 isoform X2 [Maniola jurtina]|uniref:uncharacterized protein LOC123869125 isoform X2 n=1 Tax=Maniola jurtina TaxID=191418 RepID=UPI001E68B767|nr:uncharacterized protein LOC123869125 isoform X2 [Maniola jurtina]
MSHSPRKFISHLTANRGVEAREFQTENPRLEADISSGDSERRAYAAGDARAASDNSASFVQVVVHKQRLAAASSPSAAPQRARTTHKPNPPQTPPTPLTVGGDAAAALLAPALAALQRQLWDKVQSLNNAPAQAAGLYTAAMPDVNDKGYTGSQKTMKNTIWNKVSRLKAQDLDSGKDMARIEVYQFERGAALVCTRRDVRVSHVERVARRLGQPGAVLLRELLGAIRVLIAAPLHVALQLVHCTADSAQ